MLTVTKGQIRGAVDKAMGPLVSSDVKPEDVESAIQGVVDTLEENHIENENTWNGG